MSKRPPKKWMKDCMKGARHADDPGAVCGDLWYNKMTEKERRAAKRRHYSK